MFRVQKEDAPGCVVSASVSIPPDKVDPIIFFIMKHHEESCSLRAVNVSGLLWLEHRMWKCEINLLSPKMFQPPPRLLFHSRVHPRFSSTHRLSVSGGAEDVSMISITAEYHSKGRFLFITVAELTVITNDNFYTPNWIVPRLRVKHQLETTFISSNWPCEVQNHLFYASYI